MPRQKLVHGSSAAAIWRQVQQLRRRGHFVAGPRSLELAVEAPESGGAVAQWHDGADLGQDCVAPRSSHAVEHRSAQLQIQQI